jgi:hypothetical protein
LTLRSVFAALHGEIAGRGRGAAVGIEVAISSGERALAAPWTEGLLIMHYPTDDDDAATQFWISSLPPAPEEVEPEITDHRPTVRPTGDADADAPSDRLVGSSGIHRVAPLHDDREVESIQAAVLKLLAG